MKKFLTVLLALLLPAFAVFSSEPDPGTDPDIEPQGVQDTESFKIAKEKWDKLSDAEKEKLKRIYKEWKELPPQRRAWILMNHKRYKKMSEEEKEELVAAYREWKKLSPQMKRKIKNRYAAWKRLTPRQRYLIKKAYEKYQDLSPMEKATVRHKVKTVSQEE